MCQVCVDPNPASMHVDIPIPISMSSCGIKHGNWHSLPSYTSAAAQSLCCAYGLSQLHVHSWAIQRHTHQQSEACCIHNHYCRFAQCQEAIGLLRRVLQPLQAAATGFMLLANYSRAIEAHHLIAVVCHFAD